MNLRAKVTNFRNANQQNTTQEFPQNVCLIFADEGNQRVLYLPTSENVFPGLSSFVPGLSVWSLLARLRPGEGTPSLFPPALHFSGPGAPPDAAAEVATDLPQSLQKRRQERRPGSVRITQTYL